MGQWKEGAMNGKGTYYYTSQNQYTGDWLDNNQTGEGTFTWTNGDRYESVYSVIYTLFIHHKCEGKQKKGRYDL